MTRSSRALLLVLPALLAGKCKDKAPPDDTDVVDDGSGLDVDSELLITRLVPNKVDANVAFDLNVYGEGFQKGAVARIGDDGGVRVTFLDSETISVASNGMAAGEYDLVVTNPDGASATRYQGLTVGGSQDPRLAGLDCDNMVVKFEFDSHSLTAESKTVLDQHLACFEAKPGTVRIAGHADERGTTEYNIALGQRRAEAIRAHLVGRNVLPSRINTVSFGEEKPINPAHTESAWEENRRGEVGVKE